MKKNLLLLLGLLISFITVDFVLRTRKPAVRVLSPKELVIEALLKHGLV